MSNYSDESASSVDDSEDFDDVPLSIAPNGRYEEGPLTCRGPPIAFNRPGAGLHLKLPVTRLDELPPPGLEGLPVMRSEPASFGETGRIRPQPGLTLPKGVVRAVSASTSYSGVTDESSALLGRRGSLKPPMLNLVNPASASPVPSGAPTPAVTEHGEALLRPTAWHPPTQKVACRPPLHVDLISSAFVLQSSLLQDGPTTAQGGEFITSGAERPVATGASARDRITLRCSSQLGIAPCDLELFELRALEEGEPLEGCTRVGVMIRGSSFSLSALEDLLARSKRDSQLTTLLDSALRDSARHQAEAREKLEQLARKSEEVVLLRERLRGSEAINQHLREQLQRSDEHRQLLGGTIRTIKKEFEDFKSRVVDEDAGDPLPQLQQLHLGVTAAATVAGAPPGPGTGAAGAAPTAASGSSTQSVVGPQPVTWGTGGSTVTTAAAAPGPRISRDGAGKR